MHERTKNLLIELYALDPSLKEHEPALIAVLERISAAKPDVRIDQAFLTELRKTLVTEPSVNMVRPPTKNPFVNLFDTMSKTPFILGGLAMTAILAAVIVTMPGTTTPTGDQTGSQLAMVDGIIDAAPGAFGELGSFGTVGRQGGAAEESANSAVPAMAPSAADPAVLGTPAAISSRPMSGGGSGVSMDSKMMIAPYWPAPIYKLAYDPANPPIAIAEQSVYRRSIDAQAATSFVSAVTGRDNGLLDLAALRDLRVERISLFEDRTDGYQTELNLFDGSLYMNLDWRHTQYDPAMDQPISPSEMPSDASLVAAADAFMDRFAIDRSAYGAPVVDKTWQRYVLMADGAEGAYAPSSVSVVYPLLVDGAQVAEFGGELAGPRVNIRVRDLKVMNLFGLTTRRFERSSYALETDTARIIAFAEKGGIRGPVYQPYRYDDQGNMIPSEEPTTVLTLGPAEQILMKMYRPDGNSSVELYLPALRFPIMNAPTDPNFYGPRDVIVPLVKDIIDEYERSMSEQPVPMPVDLPAMTEPAVLR